MKSQKGQNDLCSFPSQTIQYHGNPSLCLTSNAEEAEVEWFYEDLQDLLELTPKEDVLFIIGDCDAKEGSQELPGVTANLENSAGATGLEKVSFHFNPKERQCQRILKLPHNCTHLPLCVRCSKFSKPGFSNM